VETDMTTELDLKDSKRMRELLLRAAANLATAVGDERDSGILLDALDNHQALSL